MMNILVLGSCRVHGPINAIAGTGRCIYSTGGSGAYLHSANEAVQRLAWIESEIELPERLAPYLFSTDRIPKPSASVKSRALQADALLVEIASEKEFACQGVYLQSNYLQRHLVSPLGELGTKWWRQLVTTGQADPALVDEIVASTAFAETVVDDFDEVLLRETTCVLANLEDLTARLDLLKRRWRKPVGVVSHVGVPLANAKRLASREDFIDRLRQSAGTLGIPVLEPASVIGLVGRSTALGRDGEDIDHIAPGFEPAYGWFLLNRFLAPLVAR